VQYEKGSELAAPYNYEAKAATKDFVGENAKFETYKYMAYIKINII
jgi:hypothetical protein